MSGFQELITYADYENENRIATFSSFEIILEDVEAEAVLLGVCAGEFLNDVYYRKSKIDSINRVL